MLKKNLKYDIAFWYCQADAEIGQIKPTQVINAVSLETNLKGRIYIGNYSTNMLISVDLNFKLMKHLALIYLNKWEFPHLTMTTLNFFHLILNFMKTFYLFVI